MRRSCLVLPALALAVAAPRVARAQAMCANSATGVPDTYGQPPLDWWDFTSPAAATPFDPRWVGSSGHSLSSGSATSPVELRTVWADVGGQRYLYMSFQFFVDLAEEKADHVLYLGFEPVGGATRVVRLRFQGGDSTAAISYCPSPGSTAQAGCSATTNYYTVYATDLGYPSDSCGSIVPDASTKPNLKRLGRLGAADAAANLSWLTTTARYWTDDWIDDPLTGLDIDRWTVQLRIPITASTDLTTGIPEGTRISYQAQLEDTALAGQLYFEPWPRAASVGEAEKFCSRGGTIPSVYVADTATFRPIHLSGGGAPAPAEGCSGTVRVEQLGVIDEANPTGPLITTMNTSGAIRIAARIVNDSPSPIAAGALIAQFRMADWGAQSWAGAWTDVPFTTSGAPGEVTNASTIGAGTTGEVVLGPWTPTDAQRCQYTYWQGATSGWPSGSGCSLCDSNGDGSNDGARFGAGACLPGKSQHQCTAVELRGGDVDWQRRSVYNNLDFAPLSQDQRVAHIDTTGLPTRAGQKDHDIYFVVMPRNMPRSTPPKTYEQLMGEQAQRLLDRLLAEAGQWDDPEPEDPQPDDNWMAKRLPKNMMMHDHLDPRIEQLPPRVRDEALLLAAVARLAEQKNPDMTTEQVVHALGAAAPPDLLVQLVPTLEVYVYYAVPASKDEGGQRLLPMTSWTLVTHHDGAVESVNWALDGVEHVKGNVYRKTIPVAKVGRVNVRLQAGEGTFDDPNPDWPCQGGCFGCTKTCSGAVVNNAGLLTLAFLWANRRRRRRGEPAL